MRTPRPCRAALVSTSRTFLRDKSLYAGRSEACANKPSKKEPFGSPILENQCYDQDQGSWVAVRRQKMNLYRAIAQKPQK
jgi:hypothetical protein